MDLRKLFGSPTYTGSVTQVMISLVPITLSGHLTSPTKRISDIKLDIYKTLSMESSIFGSPIFASTKLAASLLHVNMKLSNEFYSEILCTLSTVLSLNLASSASRAYTIRQWFSVSSISVLHIWFHPCIPRKLKFCKGYELCTIFLLP